MSVVSKAGNSEVLWYVSRTTRHLFAQDEPVITIIVFLTLFEYGHVECCPKS